MCDCCCCVVQMFTILPHLMHDWGINDAVGNEEVSNVSINNKICMYYK